MKIVVSWIYIRLSEIEGKSMLDQWTLILILII